MHLEKGLGKRPKTFEQCLRGQQRRSHYDTYNKLYNGVIAPRVWVATSVARLIVSACNIASGCSNLGMFDLMDRW